MRIVDWQSLSADRVALLYAEESERWQRLLDWDIAPRWSEIERRRRQGLEAGLAVVDDAGTVQGWSHFAVRDRVLRIDTLNAGSESVGQVLIEHLLSSRALAYVERVSLLAFADAAGLTQALRAAGLSVDRYWYLGREATRVSPLSPPGLRGWNAQDVHATAELLLRSYEPTAESRPFAAGGSREQWVEYVTALTRGDISGALMPDASLCLPEGPDRLAAVALVTRTAEGAAQIAQLVVDPTKRRRQLGTQLLELASAAAARAGCRRVSMMVGGSNRPGRALLEAARFKTMGSLLAAGALQPRRSTSVAPVGAFMTRR